MRSSLRSFVMALFMLAATFVVPSAEAAWQPGGVRLSAPPNPEYLEMDGIVSDGAQGAIVSWIWNYQVHIERTDRRAMVQRIDGLGNIPAPWPADGIAVRTWTFERGVRTMYPIPAISNGAGGVYVPSYFEITYSGEIRNLLDLFRVDVNAAVAGLPNYSVPNVDFWRMVVTVRVVEDGSGGVIYANNTVNYLVAHRVDSQGNDLWGQYLPDIPVLSHPVGSIGQCDVLADGAGGAFFAWWETPSAGLPTIRVQHLDANGAIVPGWPAQGTVVRSLAGGLDRLVLKPNGAGGVFVVWVDKRAGTNVTDIYAHNVLANGSLAPGIPMDGRPIQSPNIRDEFGAVESDEQGGLYLVRLSNDNGTNHQVRLYRLDAALLPHSGWPAAGMMLKTTYSGYGDVALVADGDGGAFLAFRSNGAVYPVGMIGQHLAGDGSPAPGWTSAGYVLTSNGVDPRIVRSGTGAIVAWNDFRAGPQGIYAQRLVPDGPVAVQVSLVSAEAVPGEASLHWYVSGAAALSATVERRSMDSDWEDLASVNADGQGRVEYVDRSVGSGRYAYRLSWMEDGAVRHSGEAWVDVPGSWKLALSTPRPNPGAGAATFSVTLPTRASGSMELLDLQGRRVAYRDVGALDAGVHTITIDEASTLAPGLYLARLTHGAESRTVRITRIR